MSNGNSHGVRNPDIVQEELKQVHECYRSWRRVGSLPAYFPIPAGTLSSIAKTGEIPKKWRQKLRVQDYKPAPVCSLHGIVHCFDCEKEQIKPIPKPRKKRRFWKDYCLPDPERFEKVLNGWVLNEGRGRIE